MDDSLDRNKQWTPVPEWERGLVCCARRYPTLRSTNSTMLQESDCYLDQQLALLIAADEQTSGRGRVGRQWYADAGTLTFSILDCVTRHGLSDDQIPIIAIIAGVSIAEAIEGFVGPIQTRLKWPNDVYVDGGKVAGILVEGIPGKTSRFVLGVGVNVDTDLHLAPPEIRDTARSLGMVVGRPLERYSLVPYLVERLSENLERASSNFPEIIEAFRDRCLLTGHEVTWLRGNQTVRGQCIGISHDGGMRVRIADKVETIYSGELVRIANRT